MMVLELYSDLHLCCSHMASDSFSHDVAQIIVILNICFNLKYIFYLKKFVVIIVSFNLQKLSLNEPMNT